MKSRIIILIIVLHSNFLIFASHDANQSKFVISSVKKVTDHVIEEDIDGYEASTSFVDSRNSASGMLKSFVTSSSENPWMRAEPDSKKKQEHRDQASSVSASAAAMLGTVCASKKPTYTNHDVSNIPVCGMSEEIRIYDYRNPLMTELDHKTSEPSAAAISTASAASSSAQQINVRQAVKRAIESKTEEKKLIAGCTTDKEKSKYVEAVFENDDIGSLRGIMDEFPDLEGKNLLSLAASERNAVKCLNFLLKSRQELKPQSRLAFTKYDFQAFHNAIIRGNLQICEIYIEWGIDINAEIDQLFPFLYTAVYKGQTEIVKKLLHCRATLNYRTKTDKNSLLHVAAEKGDLEIVEQLIDQRIDINAKNLYGKTALQLATEKMDATGEDKYRLIVEKLTELTKKNKTIKSSNVEQAGCCVIA